MSYQLIWRRCAACGQLTLVPSNASVCWQCGAPLAGDPPAADASPAAAPNPFATQSPLDVGLPGGMTPVTPDPVPPRAVNRAAVPSPADLNLPPPGPRPMDLTPADDLVARRLLRSIFPDGVDL